MSTKDRSRIAPDVRAAEALESIAESLKALAAIAPKVGEAYAHVLELAPTMATLAKMATVAAERELGVVSAPAGDGN